MNPLFWRSLSEGLQASVPVALYLAWTRRLDNSAEVRGIRWGIVAAVPFTIAAGFVFQSSSRQSLWEVAFALAALFPAARFAWITWGKRQSASGLGGPGAALPLGAALTAIVITRQAMLIFAVLTAALALGSFEATSAICTGTTLAIAIAMLVGPLARRLSREALLNAARACSLVFLAEVALYAVHKAAESRLLPWSEPIETATEPYGPDGLYGLYISYLLVLAPAVVAAIGTLRGLYGGSGLSEARVDASDVGRRCRDRRSRRGRRHGNRNLGRCLAKGQRSCRCDSGAAGDTSGCFEPRCITTPVVSPRRAQRSGLWTACDRCPGFAGEKQGEPLVWMRTHIVFGRCRHLPSGRA